MISIISRGKPLILATECLVKSEAIGFLFYSNFQRTLYTENYFLSNSTFKQKRKNPNVRNFRDWDNLPKNFGKVFELDGEFRDLEDKPKRKKKKSFKRIERNAAYSLEKGEEEIEKVEDAEELIKKIEYGEKAIEVAEDAEEGIDDNSKDSKYYEIRNYENMKRNLHVLSSIMVQLKSKRRKEKINEIFLEGRRIIHEAIKAGLTPKKIFFSRASDLDDIGLPEGTRMYRIPYKAFKLWGDLTTPQGLIGIFQMPDAKTLKVKSECLPLTVICDNVRDPGNLGSIIRIVASVGCERLILTTGCTGVWEPKVLRASAGAHFHMPILKNYVWSDIENLIGDTSRVFLADGHAISETQSIDDNSNKFTKISEISQQLPLVSYCSVEFQNQNTVIVIGGETHGVSDDAYEFARKRNGTRIFIPLKNEIESLNNSVALAVLAFEYKRQLNCIAQKESPQRITAYNE